MRNWKFFKMKTMKWSSYWKKILRQLNLLWSFIGLSATFCTEMFKERCVPLNSQFLIFSDQCNSSISQEKIRLAKYENVRQWTKHCSLCQKSKVTRNVSTLEVLLISHEAINIDRIGPLPPSYGNDLLPPMYR